MTFLYQSISDTQGTIKAIDAKIGFLLIFLVIPITNVNRIYLMLLPLLSQKLPHLFLYVHYAWIAAFCSCWFLAFVAAVKGITALDNPALHINNIDNPRNGTFYFGGSYKFGAIDTFFNRKSVKSAMSLENFQRILPLAELDLIGELAFEKMKLAYIRDLKMLRQKCSAKLTLAWLTIGFGMYVYLRVWYL